MWQQFAQAQQMDDPGQPLGFGFQCPVARAGKRVVPAAAVLFGLLDESVFEQAREKPIQGADLQTYGAPRLPLHFLHDFVAMARLFEQHQQNVKIGGLERRRRTEIGHASNWNTGSLLVIEARVKPNIMIEVLPMVVGILVSSLLPELPVTADDN